MSQFFCPYIVLNLSAYANEDDLDYFKGKNLIGKDYLVFVPMNKYLNKISVTLKVFIMGIYGSV